MSACNTLHSSSAHEYVCNDPTSQLLDLYCHRLTQPLPLMKLWLCRTGTDLYRELDKCTIGEEVDLEILRGSEKVSLKVTLGSNN